MGAALSRAWRAVAGRWRAPITPAPFEYHEALDSRSIRLLRFVAPTWYHFGLVAPRLLITTHRLDDLPKYVAWSYTWVPPHERFTPDSYWDRLPVLVNGKPFFVLRNLMESLRCLLWRWDFNDDVQHVWIDAICINQDDVEERAAQVGIMDRIYRGASSTAIWLGKATPDSDRAKQMFHAVCQIPAEELAPYYREYPNGTPPPDELWHAHGLPSVADEDGWRPLMDFFSYRWFSRAWIIQEVTLSTNNMCLFWGHNAMNWTAFGHIAFAGQVAKVGRLNNLPGLSRHLSGETDELLSDTTDWVVADPLVNSFHLWYNRHRYLQRGQKTVNDTMSGEMKALTGCSVPTAQSWLMYFSLMHRWTEATDPRDKVFAHLGIVNNIAEQDGLGPVDIKASYSDDVTSAGLYQQVMASVVDEIDSLAVLMALNDPPSSRQPGLASWIPDLSRQHGLDLMWSIRPQFSASGAVDHNGRAGSRRVRVQGPYLHVKCTVLGTIGTLSSSLADFIGPNWHGWAEDLRTLDEVYPYTGEPRVEAFWRTLLMNSVARKHPARWPGSDDGDMFRAYVLQSMARYFPGPGSDSASREKYIYQLQDVNYLAAADTSGRLPSFTGLTGLTSQISGVPEEELGCLSEEAMAAGLDECVDRASRFLVGMDGSMVNRRILLSSRGHLANGPMWAEVSDRIAILDGCPCPVILRQDREEPSCFTLVGSAYVHGVMYGECIGEETAWEEVCIK